MSNQTQIDYWNGKAGDTWANSQARLDTMLAPISTTAIDYAQLQSSEQVIDVGCGCGSTALAMNDLGASVWGIDISAPMLGVAKQRAQGRANLAFSQADAATQVYTPDHELVFSRFGVMFFADPAGALANLRKALTPSGRMVFVCWQAPRNNDWVSVGGRAVQPFLSTPAAPSDPKAPGPFAFADPDYVRSLLLEAGFGNVDIDSFTTDLLVGSNLEETIAMQSEVGPLARAIAELEEGPRNDAIAATREALRAYVTDDGIKLGSAVWLVRAT